MPPSFSNADLDSGQLPSIEQAHWQTLAPSYARMALLSGLGFWLPAGIGGLALSALGLIPVTTMLVATAWLLLLIPTLLSYPAARVKRYAIREQDVLFHEGLLWKSTTVIPRNRIQHIQTENGPLERWFGLVTLKCYGAGGQQADLVIPGLEEPLGQRLRQYLLNQADDRDEPEPDEGNDDVPQ
ncbi:PH domain-containing protein [Salicola sp. Rm-C-2C1-2]|uniref:PH domain-containing protein n=1 Tax=Salicola sp. Rm-C-2C1-2 TaxID=3141321 RepID=UPI0032E52F29